RPRRPTADPPGGSRRSRSPAPRSRETRRPGREGPRASPGRGVREERASLADRLSCASRRPAALQREGDQAVEREIARSVLARERAAPQHQDAVAHLEELLELARDQNRGDAPAAHLPQRFEELPLRAHVDPASGLIAKKDARITQEPFPEHDFLL